MESKALVLTDDEVVAVAVDSGRVWPSALPTVDIESAQALEAALDRGRRSLRARALDGPDAASTLVAARGLVNGTAVIHVYLADANFDRTSWGFTAVLAVSAGDWFIDVLTGDGTHRLAPVTTAEATAFLRAVLEGAFEAGPEGSAATGQPSEWLCALGVRGDRELHVGVRRAKIRVDDAAVAPGEQPDGVAWTPASVANYLTESMAG